MKEIFKKESVSYFHLICALEDLVLLCLAVLLDVQLLNDYIQQGKAENSDKLAKKLAEKKVQLRSTKIDHSHNESPMKYVKT